MRASAAFNVERGDRGGAEWNTSVAERDERDAAILEQLPEGQTLIRGMGEVTLPPQQRPGEPPRYDYAFRDTLEDPGTTAAAASRARMRQALDVGETALAQALDAAETVGARNSLERMAAHQMAACHGLAMMLLKDGADMVRRGVISDNLRWKTFYFVEGNRLLGTAARLVTVFQTCHATLARIRQGGRQTVKVIHQHVQVTDGGQAVVAGSVTPPGGQTGEGDGS